MTVAPTAGSAPAGKAPVGKAPGGGRQGRADRIARAVAMVFLVALGVLAGWLALVSLLGLAVTPRPGGPALWLGPAAALADSRTQPLTVLPAEEWQIVAPATGEGGLVESWQAWSTGEVSIAGRLSGADSGALILRTLDPGARVTAAARVLRVEPTGRRTWEGFAIVLATSDPRAAGRYCLWSQDLGVALLGSDPDVCAGSRGQAAVANVGGAKGTRTPDPLPARQVLYQLSYSPLHHGSHHMPSAGDPTGAAG